MEPLPHHVPEPTPYGVAPHGTSDGPSDDEPHPRRLWATGLIRVQVNDEAAPPRAPAVPDRAGEVVAAPHSELGGQHNRRRQRIGAGSRSARGTTLGSRPSAGETAAAPTPTCRDNRPAGPGTHAEPEPVCPRPAAIVRLERTLAHWCSEAEVIGIGRRRGCRPQSRRAAPSPKESTVVR